MHATRLLILGLASVIEIGLAKDSHHRQRTAHPSSSPFLRCLTGSSVHEISHPPHFHTSPKRVIEKTDSPLHPYRPHERIDHSTDRRKLKKLRGTEKHARTSHRIRSTDESKKRVGYTRKLGYTDLPPVYLEPPKLTNGHDYYTKSKEALANYSEKKNTEEVEASPLNHRLYGDEDEEGVENKRPGYVRDHAPELQVETTHDVRTNNDSSQDSSHEDAIGTPESSKDRIEFHIHGHEGPRTYIFGYDTGLGSNRQFRLEERHGDGSVTGRYGYVDARGKLRKVRYRASPTEGYVEKHHETKEQRVV